MDRLTNKGKRKESQVSKTSPQISITPCCCLARADFQQKRFAKWRILKIVFEKYLPFFLFIIKRKSGGIEIICWFFVVPYDDANQQREEGAKIKVLPPPLAFPSNLGYGRTWYIPGFYLWSFHRARFTCVWVTHAMWFTIVTWHGGKYWFFTCQTRVCSFFWSDANLLTLPFFSHASSTERYISFSRIFADLFLPGIYLGDPTPSQSENPCF